MSEAKLDLILRAFSVFDGFAGPSPEGLWWRTDGDYAPVTLLVDCNDLFVWGSADAETLTEQSINVLESAAEDMRALHPRGDFDQAGLLYCCRMRKMRPQGAYYKHIEKPWWPLFNACGPERATGVGNPLPLPPAPEVTG